ncbi:MAG TPA: cytochrome c3 family protein [Kofleriaceae bacterium]|jgi:formate-dependent nitrite reductase cytochrome c552 subunit
MAALFSPAANARLRAAAILACLGGAGAIAAPMLYIRTPYASGEGDAIQQPVEFDHRHHVRDDGIDCAYCHEGAETEVSAGLPPTERCMGCHGQVWPDSPQLAPLRDAWRAGTPLRWRRVNALPAFVYFHHGVHARAGVACAECHGRVDDMGRVVRVHDLTMSFCLDCHRRAQGSRAITRLTTCTACHR